MSVVGLDFGNANNVVALARRKGIDVVLNTESKRETPSMVNFGVKQVRAPARVGRRRSDLESSRVPSKAFGRRRATTRACPPAVIETHADVRAFLTRARVARRRFGKCGAPRAALGPPCPRPRARLPRPSPPPGDARRRGTSRQKFFFRKTTENRAASAAGLADRPPLSFLFFFSVLSRSSSASSGAPRRTRSTCSPRTRSCI